MPKYTQKQKVYVIQRELGPVKIGVAKQPEKRLSDLQVSCPFELWLKRTETPNDAGRVERFLHKFFRKYHMRGEWFDIPAYDRDFEIPTHISESGQPDTDLDLTEIRFVNHEWAMFFERTVRTVKETKYLTPEIQELRKRWRKIHPDLSDEIGARTEETPEPPEIGDPIEDMQSGQARCSHCGHFFDRNEVRCPRCGSGSYDSGADSF